MEEISKTLDPNYNVNEYRIKPLPTPMKILSLHIPKSVDNVVNKILNCYTTPFIVAAVGVYTFLQFH